MIEYSKEAQTLVNKGPCNDCGSSDACALYEDGHTYCFSCLIRHDAKEEINVVTHIKATPLLPDLEDTKVGPISERNLNAETLRAYDVRLKIKRSCS